jgi:hypothetical protein
MDVHSVMRILRNLDVEGVRKAADAHDHLGATLSRVADNLVTNGNTLAGSWQGAAAHAAVAKFQQMHAQTIELAAQAKQTAQVLHWTAGVMEQYRNLPTPVGDPASAAAHTHLSGAPGASIGDVAGALLPGAGHQAKANAQAQKYLNALNQHLVTANNALPAQIGPPHSARAVSAVHMGNGTAGGAGLGSSARGGAGSGAGSGLTAGSGSRAAVPTFASASPSHSGAGQAAALQGAVSPGGGTATLPSPSGSVSAGTTGPTGMPGIIGAPAEASERTRTKRTRKATVEGGTLPDAEAADTNTAESTAALTGSDGNGGPGHDGHRNESENGAGGTADAGMMAGGTGLGPENQERQRQVWMNEDTDIWGVPRTTIGSMIDGDS